MLCNTLLCTCSWKFPWDTTFAVDWGTTINKGAKQKPERKCVKGRGQRGIVGGEVLEHTSAKKWITKSLQIALPQKLDPSKISSYMVLSLCAHIVHACNVSTPLCTYVLHLSCSVSTTITNVSVSGAPDSVTLPSLESCDEMETFTILLVDQNSFEGTFAVYTLYMYILHINISTYYTRRKITSRELIP